MQWVTRIGSSNSFLNQKRVSTFAFATMPDTAEQPTTVFLSLLYATAKMFEHHAEPIRNECYSDRMPADLLALRVAIPKLSSLRHAAHLFLNSKRLFDVRVEQGLRQKCASVRDIIDIGLVPLLRRMRERTQKYATITVSRDLVRELRMDTDRGAQFFQHAFRDELESFDTSLKDLAKIVEEIEYEYPEVRRYVFNKYLNYQAILHDAAKLT